MKLVKPSKALEQAYVDYIMEWENAGEKIVPYASGRYGLAFDELLNKWQEDETEKAYEKGFVPASLYFLIDEKEKIVGSVHIRHELNERLLFCGGHIGYGVRPSERRKGYASTMLSLSLSLAKKLGVNKALVTCGKSNLASALTIQKNGGILDNEVMHESNLVQRYWINLD